MNPIASKLKIYTYSVTALSLAAIILRTLCLYFAYDSSLGYYAYDNPLPLITNAVSILTLLWAASALLFIPRSTLKPTLPDYSIASTFTGALCGFIFLFISSANALGLLLHTVSFPAESRQRDMIVFVLITVFAFLSAIYFFTALKSSLLRTPWRIFLGFSPVAWAILTLARAYFDFYHTMNDPNKIMLELALMAAMLFFLHELRSLLARTLPRLGFFYHLAALLLCGSASIAALAALPCAIATIADFRYDFILVAALWLYMLTRLFDHLHMQLASKDNAGENEAAS